MPRLPWLLSHASQQCLFLCLGVLAPLPAEMHGVESHDSCSRRLSMWEGKVAPWVGHNDGGWRVGGQQDGLLDVLYGGAKESG